MMTILMVQKHKNLARTVSQTSLHLASPHHLNFAAKAASTLITGQPLLTSILTAFLFIIIHHQISHYPLSSYGMQIHIFLFVVQSPSQASSFINIFIYIYTHMYLFIYIHTQLYIVYIIVQLHTVILFIQIQYSLKKKKKPNCNRNSKFKKNLKLNKKSTSYVRYDNIFKIQTIQYHC